jgi:hypothetical protein
MHAEGPKRSPMAQEITRWAISSYELSLILVGVCLVGTTSFALFSTKPIVSLGIVPVLLIYLFGCLSYCLLKAASAIYDPTRLALQLMSGILVNLALFGVRSFILPGIKSLGRGGCIKPLSDVSLCHCIEPTASTESSGPVQREPKALPLRHRGRGRRRARRERAMEAHGLIGMLRRYGKSPWAVTLSKLALGRR